MQVTPMTALIRVNYFLKFRQDKSSDRGPVRPLTPAEACRLLILPTMHLEARFRIESRLDAFSTMVDSDHRVLRLD